VCKLQKSGVDLLGSMNSQADVLGLRDRLLASTTAPVTQQPGPLQAALPLQASLDLLQQATKIIKSEPTLLEVCARAALRRPTGSLQPFCVSA
jgi:hypothetical protein